MNAHLLISWGSCTCYTALVLEGSHTSHPAILVEGSHFFNILKAVDLLVGSGGVENGHCHGQFVVLFFVVEQFAVAVVEFGKIMGVS